MRTRSGWVLGPAADVAIFSGPIVLAFLFIGAAGWGGFLDADLPPAWFAILIIGCDVAHVYATAFRVYLDKDELRRSPTLYLGVPLLCFAVGVLLHDADPTAFWRTLAYLALFHFVRQQWGWIAYSRRAAGETGAWERRFDQLAIYNATLFPLLWWHANLPQRFVWFVDGDFQPGLAPAVGNALLWVHWGLIAAWLGWQVALFITGRGINVAKVQIWVTTWIAWYGGIVWIGTDIAFTALNVLSHGVPYLAVVYRLERRRRGARGEEPAPPWRAIDRLFTRRGIVAFLGVLVLLGYVEEWIWDALVWHEHGTLFPGPRAELGEGALSLAVALLAVPQATHYLIDGWIWRTARHPELALLVGGQALAGAPESNE